MEPMAGNDPASSLYESDVLPIELRRHGASRGSPTRSSPVPGARLTHSGEAITMQTFSPTRYSALPAGGALGSTNVCITGLVGREGFQPSSLVSKTRVLCIRRTTYNGISGWTRTISFTFAR